MMQKRGLWSQLEHSIKFTIPKCWRILADYIEGHANNTITCTSFNFIARIRYTLHLDNVVFMVVAFYWLHDIHFCYVIQIVVLFYYVPIHIRIIFNLEYELKVKITQLTEYKAIGPYLSKKEKSTGG
jgi:hypothetical protein